jgi:hypothetical protein
MMKWGDTKLFEVLESGLNDFGEIAVQHFESSDNHRQLEVVLETLHRQGLNPSIVFTDVPGRDRNLLERIFPMLTEGIREVDFQVDNDEGLDALELRGKIQYVQKLEAARAALQTLSESLDAAPKSERVVSFDTEWPVFDGGHRITCIAGVR